jgi:DNA-binding PadR family transcriptional regulator
MKDLFLLALYPDVESYGAQLAALFAKHESPINAGTLYTLLQRMEADGLVSSRLADRVGKGERRRLYRLTGEGKEAVEKGLELRKKLLKFRG